MKVTLLVACCVLLIGCTRHPDARVEQILVCGILTAEDGRPMPEALIHLHRIAKDIPGDPKSNAFEVAATEGNGSFVLGSAAPDRQYWIAIAGVHACSAVFASQLESARIPVKFHRSESTEDCKANIHVVLTSCVPKLE